MVVPNFKIGAAIAVATCALAAGGIAVAGAEKPDLEAKIDSAQDEARLISDRISNQSARIEELQAQADESAAKERDLQAQLREATARSKALNDDLLAAEKELDEVRARYDRAVGILSERLVEIYKAPEADVLSVILGAEDFDDLEGRAEYFEALNDADARIAERVRALRDEVDARYDEIADLKAGIDEEARKLEESREQLAAERAAAQERAGEIAAAKADAEAALGELQQDISGWELEVRKAAAEEIAGSGGEAFLGGPYSIPTYIVMCESGGNYRAVNPSSGAGGAYQILPSTWAAYGGKGLPQNASKAEQDRIAAIIWREDGPGAWSCA